MKASRAQFENRYSGKRVLVTGHTGFKGAWLAFWLKELGAEVFGIALEEPGAPAAYSALGVGNAVNKQYLLDIRDTATINSAVREIQPNFVFHLAAQPLVLASYASPLETLQVNFMGTAHILEAIRALNRSVACVVVTSDKCYANDRTGKPIHETAPMGGRDLYSMSKGACELLVDAYRHSFGTATSGADLRVATARAGNVLGGGDYAENRLIPDVVRALTQRHSLTLRNPLSTRPWQFVLDVCAGYLTLGAALLGPEGHQFCEGWNFGPDSASAGKSSSLSGRTTEQVVTDFLKAWEETIPIERSDTTANKEEPLLALNIEKAKKRLHWKPRYDYAQTIQHTAQWYKYFELNHRRQHPNHSCVGSMRDFSKELLDAYS